MAREKVRETRLRRMAERQGLALQKSRRRDPRAIDYGMYMLVDPSTSTVVAGRVEGRAAFTIDEVEDWLTNPIEQREA